MLVCPQDKVAHVQSEIVNVLLLDFLVSPVCAKEAGARGFAAAARLELAKRLLAIDKLAPDLNDRLTAAIKAHPIARPSPALLVFKDRILHPQRLSIGFQVRFPRRDVRENSIRPNVFYKRCPQ